MNELQIETKSVNVQDIDNIVDHLQQSVRDECQQRRKDIEYLQVS